MSRINHDNRKCYICEESVNKELPRKFDDCDMYGNKQRHNICEECYKNEIGVKTWINKCRTLNN